MVIPAFEPSRRPVKAMSGGDKRRFEARAPPGSLGRLLLAFMLISLAVVAIGSQLLGVNGWNALSTIQRMTIFAALTASVFLLAISVVRRIGAWGETLDLSPVTAHRNSGGSDSYGGRYISGPARKPRSYRTGWRA